MLNRYKVAGVAEIPEGEGREFVTAGRIVAIFHVNGEFFALDGICPHAGGPLAKGQLNDRIVTCPWHGWQFDVTTGQHCLNDRICQSRFPLSVEGTDLWIELPA